MPAADVSTPPIAQVDEVDYEARLAAYRQLQPAAWRSIVAGGGAAVLLQRCFLDLRHGDDLTLRHAAAQALARFLEAAAADGELQEGSAEERLVLTVVFASVKRSIAAQNLAVRQVSRMSVTAVTECGGIQWPQCCYKIGDCPSTRHAMHGMTLHYRRAIPHPLQEHLALLRSLCVHFPARFAELSLLAAADIEVDFFANVAHLQMHRRVRALHRLTKACHAPNPSASPLVPLAEDLGSVGGTGDPPVMSFGTSLTMWRSMTSPVATVCCQEIIVHWGGSAAE